MKLILVLVSLFWILAIPRDTYAYLDPGSGSYMLQLIIGFVFGGIVTLKLFWKKIKSFIRRIFDRFYHK